MKFAPAALLAILHAATLATGSPVEQVVHLLQDLQARLGSDEQKEQQVYDKYACWCEKTTQRKADDIKAGTDQIRFLGQSILKLKGRIATLESEIAELDAQIEAIVKAMQQATSLREKQNAKWQSESELVKSCLVTLEEAITVLVNGTSFLQSSAQAASAVKQVISIIPESAALKPGQMEQLSAFVQAGGSNKYMPQSFTVQGILVNMYSTFASDLEAATREEAHQNMLFEDYMNQQAVAKAAAEAEKAAKEAAKAQAEEQLAETQSLYDDTVLQKEADIKFFDATKAACLSKHDDWETRSSLRQEEIAGVQQALSILTTDANRELFARSIDAGKETYVDNSYDTGRNIAFKTLNFLQLDSATAAQRAYAVLKEKATELHSLRLASLAARVRFMKKGHFEDVIALIDTIMTELKNEGEADVAKRDQCLEEYQKIESSVKQLTWEIEVSTAKIAKLVSQIDLRTQEKADTLVRIGEVQQEKLDLKAQREAENAEFNSTKIEKQDTIDVLISARTALMAYYKNHSIDMGPIQGSVKALALEQQGPDFDISADQAPEAVFTGKGHRKHDSKGITSILTMIIEDVNDEIRAAMQAEEEAQLHYEELIRQADALLVKLNQKVVDLSDAITKLGGLKLIEENKKQEDETDLQAEKDYKKAIKNDCDFIIRTFTDRAKARTQEFNGLEAAKAFLVGATTPAPEAGMLQTNGRSKAAFDDTALPSAQFLGLGR